MTEMADLIRSQLERDGTVILTVTGSIMTPMVCHLRDQIQLQRLRGPLKKGDVILYRRENGQHVLHRVVVSEDLIGCMCCGDDQWEPELVHRPQVVGIVCRFWRDGREHSVNDLSYRLYVGLWTGIFPFRRPVLRLKRWLGSWKHACTASAKLGPTRRNDE